MDVSVSPKTTDDPHCPKTSLHVFSTHTQSSDGNTGVADSITVEVEIQRGRSEGTRAADESWLEVEVEGEGEEEGEGYGKDRRQR